MERLITFTADDLGLNESTNLAIERAHQQGVLNAASLMMGQAGTGHALEIIRRNPQLAVGWHVHVCDSTPLTRTEWPWASSPWLAGLAISVLPWARALVQREIRAQWEAFLATGVSCQFLNGHHHMHIHPWISQQMRETVPHSFNGWVRGFGVSLFSKRRLSGITYKFLGQFSKHSLIPWSNRPRTNSLWGLDRSFRMSAGEVFAVLSSLPEGHHEFLFHPRFDGDADQEALLKLRFLIR